MDFLCVWGGLEIDAPGIGTSLMLSLKLRNAVIEELDVLNE
jgi:hypothetical protein